jgi:DpnII restriction endonuclease
VVNGASSADAVGGLAGLAAAWPSAPRGISKGIAELCEALNEFGECVRYLNTRRSEGAILALNTEAAVQDALYLIVRPWIRDLVSESPSEKTANRFSLADFTSRSLRLVLEAKFVRDKPHGKALSKELHDDIEVYRHHPYCETIVFFVYDPDSHIPDQRELRRTIEHSRVYEGRSLTCTLIIKP